MIGVVGGVVMVMVPPNQLVDMSVCSVQIGKGRAKGKGRGGT